jgi:hypothetical protein
MVKIRVGFQGWNSGGETQESKAGSGFKFKIGVNIQGQNWSQYSESKITIYK